MEYSVIIPTCDRNDFLRKCLTLLNPSFQTTRDKYEVVVTDDGRHNQAKKLIFDEFEWVKWVEGPKRGPAANRNNGAKNANGNWYIFIDDDCLPDENLILEYSREIKSNPEISIMEGCIDVDRPKERLDEESPVNKTGDMLWSCNFAIRKDQFDFIKGFDEKYLYAAMEDVDLHTRLIQAGLNMKFVPSAKVIHPWRKIRPFRNFKKRIKSQTYYARKFNMSGTFKYRWYRATTFARVFYSDCRALFGFSLKGWKKLVENAVSNFILIFI